MTLAHNHFHFDCRFTILDNPDCIFWNIHQCIVFALYRFHQLNPLNIETDVVQQDRRGILLFFQHMIRIDKSVKFSVGRYVGLEYLLNTLPCPKLHTDSIGIDTLFVESIVCFELVGFSCFLCLLKGGNVDTAVCKVVRVVYQQSAHQA